MADRNARVAKVKTQLNLGKSGVIEMEGESEKNTWSVVRLEQFNGKVVGGVTRPLESKRK